jgi:hypothetical protein
LTVRLDGLLLSTTVPAATKVLDLATLGNGYPALTPSLGLTLAEAASVCLTKHPQDVSLGVSGVRRRRYSVRKLKVTDQMQRAHRDPIEATERGACGVALLVMMDVTGLTAIDRSRRGTGFDYWLGTSNNLFQNKARLEVSGILSSTPKNTMAKRVVQKRKQTMQSDATKLPAHVVVVDFGPPTLAYDVRK